MAMLGRCKPRHALALAALAACGLVSAARGETSGSVGDVTVETPEAHPQEDAPKAAAAGIHFRYNFTHTRRASRRQGAGELWLGWENGAPKIKFMGHGMTSRYGRVEITLVMDSEQDKMHFLTRLPTLEAEQCLTYGLPKMKAKDSRERLEVLEWRSRQLEEQQVAQGPAASARRHINWTTSYRLEYVTHPDTQDVVAVDLRDKREDASEEAIVKSVRLEPVPLADGEIANAESVYRQPATRCQRVEMIAELVPQELLPPYRRASALYDLLLVVTKGPEAWPRPLLQLSAAALSADLVVLLEDPDAPQLGTLSGVDLEYEATINNPKGGNASAKVRHGTLSLGVTRSGSFYRREQEENAKLGPVVFELVSDPAAMKLYANTNVSSVKQRHTCFWYEYYKPTKESRTEVAAAQPLRFRETARLGREDCGVFAAPLSGGREVLIWVDLESRHPEAILRAEVRRGSETLRSIDIKNWRQHMDESQVAPRREWACTDLSRTHLLSDISFRWPEELELEEDLASSLSLEDPELGVSPELRRATVLELLALTGDVRMGVDEMEEGASGAGDDHRDVEESIDDADEDHAFLEVEGRIGYIGHDDSDDAFLKKTEGGAASEVGFSLWGLLR